MTDDAKRLLRAMRAITPPVNMRYALILAGFNRDSPDARISGQEAINELTELGYIKPVHPAAA